MKYVLEKTFLASLLQKHNALHCKTNHSTSYATGVDPANESIIFFQTKTKVGCIFLFANKPDMSTNPPDPGISSMSDKGQRNTTKQQ